MRSRHLPLSILALTSTTLLMASLAFAEPAAEVTFGSAKHTGSRIAAKQQLHTTQERTSTTAGEARAQLGNLESTKSPSFGSARKTSMRAAALSHTPRADESGPTTTDDTRARLNEQPLNDEASSVPEKPAFGSARKTKSHAAF